MLVIQCNTMVVLATSKVFGRLGVVECFRLASLDFVVSGLCVEAANTIIFRRSGSLAQHHTLAGSFLGIV